MNKANVLSTLIEDGIERLSELEADWKEATGGDAYHVYYVGEWEEEDGEELQVEVKAEVELGEVDVYIRDCESVYLNWAYVGTVHIPHNGGDAQ